MFSGKQIPSVGVSIGIERVFAILEEKMKNSNSVRATETQIYIAQAGKGLAAERMKICSELWTVGIKAETSYKDNPKSAKAEMEFALGQGIPLVLWIGESELQ
jgi:histidyl-tRNA synthetase